MALLSKKEFAVKCGMPTNALAVYIKRGKIVLESEDAIDDTHLQNVEFFKRHPGNGITKEVVAKTNGKKKSIKAEPIKPDGQTSLYDLDKEKKTIDIESTRKRNQLLEMELAKKSGKLIPTDEVKALFAQHSKSITVSFSQFIEGFLSEIAKRSKLNANQLAEIRGRMIVMLNQAVDDAVDNTKKSMEDLQTKLETAQDK